MNHHTIPNRLSHRIRIIRKTANKKPRQVAREIGVTRETYNRYETGKLIPSLRILKKFALVYQISLDWLLLNRGKMKYEEKE